MTRPQRGFVLFLSFCILFFAIPLRAGAQDVTPLSVSAQAAVLMEARSGEIAYAKNGDVRLPMASTTKIMTALVALELMAPDEMIEVDEAAIGTEGSSIYLCSGERLTLEELLYALMLESANDAAVAIAIGTAGSMEAFVEKMNAKAASLGLTDTHFCNPHGLDDKEHYTTARELALIARAALQNPLLKTIVSTRKATIGQAADASGVRLLVNHNKMLRLYDGCIGMKTGFTKTSGRCLVCAAERDGVTVIAVTINAPDDWDDHTAMLDYGFSKYRSVELCPADFRFCLPVVGGRDAYVVLGVDNATSVTLPRDAGVIEQTIECPRFGFAPIKEGDVCGRMLFLCDTNGDGKKETVGNIPLLAQYDVAKHVPRLSLWKRIALWWRALFS